MTDKRILSYEHLSKIRAFCHETEGGIVSDLLDHIAAITEERERLRADAERYRWLRMRWSYTIFHAIFGAPESGPSSTPDKLDAAIDAAKGK